MKKSLKSIDLKFDMTKITEMLISSL